jgi:CRP/FNR family cyclic AMP-dependent transcriptional regulator
MPVSIPAFGRSYKMDLLRNVPLFRSLSKRQLNAVARYTDAHRARQGAVLTKKGQHGLEAFVIVDGRARVEVGGRKIAELGPGDFVGELSLIDGKPRTATVIAQTPMTLLVVRRRDFRSLRDTVPGLQEKLVLTLCERLRQADQALTH